MNRMTLVAIAAGFALTSTAPAQAGVRVGIHIGNDRPGYRYDERVRYDTRRIGFDNGYRDGLREGARDDRRDDRFNYRDERAYRNGDAGYRGYYGPRGVYVDAYRQGFAEGYRVAYTRARHGDRGRSERWDRYDRDDRHDRYDRYDRR